MSVVIMAQVASGETEMPMNETKIVTPSVDEDKDVPPGGSASKVGSPCLMLPLAVCISAISLFQNYGF